MPTSEPGQLINATPPDDDHFEPLCDRDQLELPSIEEIADAISRQEDGTVKRDGRHPGSARFHEVLRETGDLHDRKQADYGSDVDPFANVRASEEWGVPPWVGALVRLNDKVTRLKSLARKGTLANESAEDSMRDIAVYAIIALVLFEEARDGEVPGRPSGV